MNNRSVIFHAAGVDLGSISTALQSSVFLQGVMDLRVDGVMELRVDPFHLYLLYKFTSAFHSALEDKILLQPFIYYYFKYITV